jgi:hypothetical protein
MIRAARRTYIFFLPWRAYIELSLHGEPDLITTPFS